MSRRTVEIARDAAEALGAGDFDGWLSLHSDDCEFVPLIVGVEGGEPYRGHDGRVWQTFKTRDGKAVWWCIYLSEQEALDAL